MDLIFISLAGLFFLGHALNWFFIRTKVPDLLILVFLGYALGPIFGLVNPEDLGKVGAVISTTALIVILYEGGIHLSARDLLTSSLPALKLSLVGFGLIAVAGTLVGLTIGMQSLVISLLIGVGIGSTSSAIVIPMVKPLTIRDQTKTILSLESAFTDVLAIILFLGLVESALSGEFSLASFLLGLGSKPLVSSALGIGFGLLWALLKHRFENMLSMPFSGEAWALLCYGIAESLQMNGAVGVLALGFTLANLDLLPDFLKSQINTKPISMGELSLLSAVTFLLRTFFFIYLGMLIQFSNLHVVIIALVLTIFVFLTRYLAIRWLFPKQEFTRLDAMVAVAMGPRGLACAVLATVPLQRGVVGGEWVQNTVFAVIPFTIFLTAVFVALAENESLRAKISKFFLMYPNGDGTPQ